MTATRDSTGTTMALGGATALAVFAPSPALTAGSVWGLMAPLGLLAAAVFAFRETALRRPLRLPPWERLDRWLIPIALAGGLLVASSIDEPSGVDSLQRAAGRAITVLGMLAVARLHRRDPGSHAVPEGLVIGALVGAVVAIAAAATSTSILGEPLRPTRGFLMPFALPKTTGMPRSFGEAGLLFSAALVLLPMCRGGRLRWFAAPVLVAAIIVGQSRNMLLTLAVAIALIVVGRLTTSASIAPPAALAALASPLLVSFLIDNLDVAGRLVGDGIFARNVEDRLSLLSQVAAVSEDSLFLTDFFGIDRQQWITVIGVAPHNHFLSLVVQDGWAGIAAVLLWYLKPSLDASSLPLGVRTPAFQAFVVGVIALSFYEGSFSAGTALILGLMHGTIAAAAERRLPAAAAGGSAPEVGSSPLSADLRVP